MLCLESSQLMQHTRRPKNRGYLFGSSLADIACTLTAEEPIIPAQLSCSKVFLTSHSVKVTQSDRSPQSDEAYAGSISKPIILKCSHRAVMQPNIETSAYHHLHLDPLRLLHLVPPCVSSSAIAIESTAASGRGV